MNSSSSHYDVIVMGVGAMGSATLYALARRGYKACGFEQFGIAHDKGSSHGETRLIRKAYFEHPDYVALLHRAYEEWEQLEAESKQELFVKSGLLLAGEADSAVIKGLKACYAQHDLPHERLEADEAKKRWPNVHLPNEVEVYYDPIAGFLHVEECIREFCRLAKKNGAELFNNEKVIGWQPTSNNSVLVTTTKRTVAADRLMITCGAWAIDALKSLNLKLEVWRKLLYWFDAPDLEPYRAGNLPSFFIETEAGGFYGFPAINKAGVKIGEHYRKDPTLHPTHLNRIIQAGEEAPFSEFVSRTLPSLNSHPNKSVVCMYTMSPDEHFILDRHPEHENVVLGAGFSGHGFKFAPVIGNILADLAIDGVTDYPMDFLRLKRFEKV